MRNYCFILICAVSCYFSNVLVLAFKCPERFEKFGETCIYYEASHLKAYSWQDAEQKCRNLTQTSSLLRIASPKDQLRLTALMGMLHYPVWIGHRCSEKCDFDLQSNSSFQFTNWKAGEPNGKSERCVMVYQREANVGEWNDEYCSKEHGFICQAPPLSNIKSNESDIDVLFRRGNCSEGFFEYNDACYHVMTHPTSKFSEIKGLCGELLNNNRTFPLVVHTQPEAALVRVMMEELVTNMLNLWVGYQIVSSSEKGSFSIPDQQKHSSDNSLIGFDDFITLNDRLRLYQIHNTTICFTIDSSNSPRTYFTMLEHCPPVNNTVAACMYYQDDHALHEDHHNLYPCPVDYQPFGEKCFKFEIGALNYSQSEAMCSSHFNGTLASIHSFLEQKKVGDEVAKSTTAWIGLTWNSMNKLFHWSDGSEVDFWHFRANEPTGLDNKNRSENCIELRSKSSEWNDIRCGKNNNRVCQITRKCTSDYILVPKYGCVKIVDEKKSLFDAWEFCQKQSADLLSFEVEAFFSHFKSTTAMKENEVYWMGLLSTGARNQITWLDKSDTSFAKSKVSLDLNSTSLDCYGIQSDSTNIKWIKKNCNTKLPFICKKNFNTRNKFDTCSEPKKTELEVGSVCLKNCGGVPCLDQPVDHVTTTASITATSPIKSTTKKPGNSGSVSSSSTPQNAKKTTSSGDVHTPTNPSTDISAGKFEGTKSSGGSVWPLVVALITITILLTGLVLYWRYRDRIRIFRSANSSSTGGTSFYNPIYSPLDINQSL